jgi:class 3 adenylate cyclase/tetratricopeptide (TPR) repeat protein
MDDIPDRAASVQAGGSRRYLTALFSDLSGSTDLSSALEAEDYADVLAKLGRVYRAVIPSHGGTVVQIQGDGVLAIFGYPEASEDDGRRATEAALDLHEAVRRFEFDLPVPALRSLRIHTGIHSGLVLVTEGDAISGRFELLGSAVNIACRLSDVARRDEILVSRETLGAESHFFETSGYSIPDLQGVAEPVSVVQVHGRSPISTRYEARTKRGLAPLIGRRVELRILDRSLREAFAGTPRVVAVVAAAGMGKTRLCEEFLLRPQRPDCSIHRGYCESYLSAEPLQPMRQIVRSLFGVTPGMPPFAAAEAVEQGLAKLDPALWARRSIFLRALSLDASESAPASPQAAGSITAAIRDLFGLLSKVKPQIIFIDDWQWADDASKQAIEEIRSLSDRPIFVLVTARELMQGDAGLNDTRLVNILPFSINEIDRTIRQILPGADPTVVAEIRKRSGGNPLFIEELCHSVLRGISRGVAPAVGGAAWLDKLIEARVERLPSGLVELVRLAAVIGNVIPVWLLERMSGYGEDHPLVKALADEDLIFPAEGTKTFRFKHGIARDVVYNSIGLRVRRAIHLQIIDILRNHYSSGPEEELYEALAYHYAACGRTEEVAKYAELAGDKAMAASALDRALLQYRAALTALDAREQSDSTYQRWMQIAQRMSLACVFDPSRDQLEILQRAAELATAHSDRRAMARTEYWIGYVNYAVGDSRTAIRHLERALASAEHVADEALIAPTRAALGQAKAASSDYGPALALFDKALAAKPQLGPGKRPPVGFAYALACKGAALGDRGEFANAHACFEEALAAIKDYNNEVEGSILCWQSGVWLWQGRWGEARRSALEAQAVAERVKSLYLYSMSLSLRGFADWNLHGRPHSLQTIADATSWLETRGRTLFISLSYGWLAEGMAACRRWQETRRDTAKAILRGRNDDRLGGTMAYRAMVRAARAGYGRRPAEWYVAHAMGVAHAREAPHEIAKTWLCDAELKLSQGEYAKADALLDQAAAAFEALAMDWHLGEATRLRGVLAENC